MGKFGAVFALIITFTAVEAGAQEASVDVNVDVNVQVQTHVRVQSHVGASQAAPAAPRTPPTFAITLQGGLQGVGGEFTPGFGMELGAQLAFERTRVGLVGGYYSSDGLFTDSRTEVSIALEVQRVFAIDPMFRPYGLLGVGAAFASVTPEEEWDPWDENDEVEQGHTERRAFGRIGAGIEIGRADGFSMQIQVAALVRYAPGGSAPAAIRLGGQLNIGLRLAL
ncbi:MAG: hypothetical protein ACI9KE_003176 [Polyangiales bacterium]|jgi:hypothetical protein